jgi:tRNA (Thr-GGU) A37 N-methylase
MSSEQIEKIKKIDHVNSTPKVDINLLMSRVRDEEKKKKTENFFILSLVGSVLLATGIIASL